MRKSYLIALAILILSFSTHGQQQVSNIISVPQEATMFLNGAQLKRSATVKISSGNTELVFSPLPPDIDPSGIQVQGIGNFTILSASFRRNFLERPELDKSHRALQDSLDYLNRQVAMNRATQKALEEEEAMLLANKSIGGSEKGVQVSELRAAADFLRDRLRDIKYQHIDLNQQIKQDQELITRMRQQLGQLNNSRQRPVGEIVVNVSAHAPVNAQFSLEYLVYNAGWVPEYDIRVEDTDSEVEMVLKASAYQHTDEDWDNVILTFSTGNPRQYGQRPVLTPWRLDFTYPEPADGMLLEFETEVFAIVQEDVDHEFAFRPSRYVDSREARTTFEFVLNIPYSLKAGGGNHMLELQRNIIPSIYQYYVVPRLNHDAFLVAKIPGWENYSLMAAEASMFFEGRYMGKTIINPDAVQDTLELSLGRDRNILVTRERMKEFSRKNFFGNRTTETLGWEITVRNNKKSPVTINLLEQVPVSVRQDIEVRIEEDSGAVIDSDRGFLTWRLEVQPGESLKRNMRYSVRYPREGNIVLE